MKKLSIVFAALVVALAVQANPQGYVCLALHTPGQLPSAESDIDGLRFSALYGECQNLNGLDLGFAGRIRERFNGAQFNLAFSIDDSDANGFALGCVNCANAEFNGLQVGLWNHAFLCRGMQLGIVNTTDRCAGFQLGLLNFADDLDGVQIGLSNYVGDQACAWLPIINVGW